MVECRVPTSRHERRRRPTSRAPVSASRPPSDIRRSTAERSRPNDSSRRLRTRTCRSCRSGLPTTAESRLKRCLRQAVIGDPHWRGPEPQTRVVRDFAPPAVRRQADRWSWLVDRPKSTEMLKIGPLTKPAGFQATAEASSATATNAASADARLPNVSSPCANADDVAATAATRRPSRIARLTLLNIK